VNSGSGGRNAGGKKKASLLTEPTDQYQKEEIKALKIGSQKREIWGTVKKQPDDHCTLRVALEKGGEGEKEKLRPPIKKKNPQKETNGPFNT